MDWLNPPWHTADSGQVEYLSGVKEFVRGKPLRTLNWLFLNPMTDPGGSPLDWRLFGSVSIRDSSGMKRPVYDGWVDYAPLGGGL